MKTILCAVLFAIGLTGIVVAAGGSPDAVTDAAQLAVDEVNLETATPTPQPAQHCVGAQVAEAPAATPLLAQTEGICQSCFRRTPCPIQCHIQCGGCQ